MKEVGVRERSVNAYAGLVLRAAADPELTGDDAARLRERLDRADEQGDEVARNLETVAVSAIARVELPAALWRKQRAGDLSGGATGILVRTFEADFHGEASAPPRFSVVAVTTAVLDEAASLVAVQALRAYDAVQLACALLARGADPECTTFACFDEGLRQAAAERGFMLVP